MHTSFHAPLAGLGLLLAAITAGYFVGSASNGPVSARLGGIALLIGGCLLAGVGALGLGVAQTWWMVPACGILVGGGSGLIDASVNAHVSLRRGVGYMGWLHASWAVGAAIAPQLVVASLALTGSWRGAYIAIGISFLLCALLAFAQRKSWTVAHPSGVSSAPSLAVPSSRYRIATMQLAALFLLGAGLEATTGNWSYSQLTLGRGVATSAASVGASLFWAGLAGARVALGIMGNRLRPTVVLDLSMATCVVGAAAFWFLPGIMAAFIALPLIGLAVSLLYPLLLSLTPGRVGAAMTGYTVGYGLAAGTFGGGLIPALIGLLLQAVGLRSLGPALTLIAGALLLVHFVSRTPSQSVRLARDRPAS